MLDSILLFLNMGGPEMMVVLFAILLLFGGKKLPELARGLGKGMREFKDASEGVKREINRNINAVNDDLSVDLDSKPSEAQKNETEQSHINS
ncbi:TatA/E family protein of Tat protein translocase [Arcticibacter tournemirensis]|uniref:Sec-independent protein translocase protein TatA n=1 Tax=Arcticibacter tournemirensis TaxID=699437 RepID=A0A5M9HH80_9SPHI|nr:twin-arginine translocase TatA/TatE family subunit [Arcticibacter tournemirensis]KAA8484688.1 twin-arginine translocase TatA/TatE family subunit [Arcticibacter tournemirensis]TQM47017.1 TatA/E family protein of Tat protein translocase [Arcticibacter tournemirensis]